MLAANVEVEGEPLFAGKKTRASLVCGRDRYGWMDFAKPFGKPSHRKVFSIKRERCRCKELALDRTDGEGNRS